jgi:hypothetical protein
MDGFSPESTASTGVGHGGGRRGYWRAVHEVAGSEAHSNSLVMLPPLACIECNRPWLVSSERWRLKVTDDVQPETVPYCPGCHTREFEPS